MPADEQMKGSVKWRTFLNTTDEQLKGLLCTMDQKLKRVRQLADPFACGLFGCFLFAEGVAPGKVE